MSVTIRKPMSREEFLVWAEAQEERYEFDGERPVLMTGGTMLHNRLMVRLLASLSTQLEASLYEVLGPEAGVPTTGNRVRYPDAVIAGGATEGSDRLVRDACAVFEIVSPSSSRIDRIVKLREYGAVDSIRYYMILESDSPAAVLLRKRPDADWIASALTMEDSLLLPEFDIDIPLEKLYAGLLK